ncbi:type IV secretion system protein [Vibrio mediterranei]|jgi:hypothetical protein
MSADTVFRGTFMQVVNEFVDRVMVHPDITQFSFSLLIFLCVLLFFVEVGRFMLIGFEPEPIIQTTLMVMVSLIFYQTHSSVFDVMLETFDNFGLLILKIGTGSSDPMFLFKWVNHALAGMYGEEISWWDFSVGDVLIYAVWQLIAIILQLVMYFIGSWAIWCLFLAKVLSPLFVPMLVHPVTRPFFDGWLKFTLGSLLLLVLVRAAGVLAALAIKAQFLASGVLQCGASDTVSNCISIGERRVLMGVADYTDLIVTMVLAIAIVLSSIKLSSTLVGGVQSPSAAVSKGASKLSGQAMKSNMMLNVMKKFSGGV